LHDPDGHALDAPAPGIYTAFGSLVYPAFRSRARARPRVGAPWPRSHAVDVGPPHLL